jgi:hypothetical protein
LSSPTFGSLFIWDVHSQVFGTCKVGTLVLVCRRTLRTSSLEENCCILFGVICYNSAKSCCTQIKLALLNSFCPYPMGLDRFPLERSGGFSWHLVTDEATVTWKRVRGFRSRIATPLLLQVIAGGGCTGIQTQEFTLARQVFHHLSHTLILFALVIFRVGFCIFSWDQPQTTMILSASPA